VRERLAHYGLTISKRDAAEIADILDSVIVHVCIPTPVTNRTTR
jgi:hypothetical protein